MTAFYNINNATPRDNMAGFDYDWTMVNPKNNKQFPANVNDWQWLNSSVPDTIKKYYNDGFMIVIFTNQSKEWKHEQIKTVCEKLEIPIYIMVATKKEEYKPNKNLFIKFLENIKLDKIDMTKSFFCGDAFGRKTDFSDSDKVFAENIGIKSYLPEEIFKISLAIGNDFNPNILASEPEIIIMVGFPGSGKSTFAGKICNHNNNYIHVEGDVYKTAAKMIKKAKEYIGTNKSIIFDATNSSKKKREEYITFGQQNNYKIKCIHITTPMNISFERNKTRSEDEQVPKIAYSVYNKHFEKPDENEGFSLINV